MATFGIAMGGIVAGSLLLLLVLYGLFRLVGLLLLVIVRLIAFVVGGLAHLLVVGAHAAVAARRRPQLLRVRSVAREPHPVRLTRHSS